MNRVLVAGIAGLAMLLTASVTTQESHAGFGRKCCGNESGGGLFSNLGSRCGGREPRATCGGGLFARMHARKAARCGGAPVDTCAPAPACGGCEAPAPACGGCETAAPACGGCETAVPACGGCAPACGGCGGQVMTSGCDGCGGMVMTGVVTSGCVNCSQTMDSGVIIESSSPSVAPPAPAPIADPVPSASDAPAAPAAAPEA